jgi:S-adenosylmethionine/arginine decarboxylase-like enzyme
MEYSSNDISAYFQHCPECDIQWRSHHLRPCENCDATGVVLVLEENQIEVLMEAVNTQFYGVDDETDILFVLSEMMIHQWPDVPAALLAQACWMHISTLEETDEIEIAKEYFEERFQDSLQEYLDEFQWEAHKAGPQGLRAL